MSIRINFQCSSSFCLRQKDYVFCQGFCFLGTTFRSSGSFMELNQWNLTFHKAEIPVILLFITCIFDYINGDCVLVCSSMFHSNFLSCIAFFHFSIIFELLCKGGAIKCIHPPLKECFSPRKQKLSQKYFKIFVLITIYVIPFSLHYAPFNKT